MAPSPPQEHQHPNLFGAISAFKSLLEPLLPPPPPKPSSSSSSSSSKERSTTVQDSQTKFNTYWGSRHRPPPPPPAKGYIVEGGDELYRVLVALHESVVEAAGATEALRRRLAKRNKQIRDILRSMSYEPFDLSLMTMNHKMLRRRLLPAHPDPSGIALDRLSLAAQYESEPIQVLFTVESLEELRRLILEDDDEEADHEVTTGEEEQRQACLAAVSNLIGPTIGSWLDWAAGKIPTPSSTAHRHKLVGDSSSSPGEKRKHVGHADEGNGTQERLQGLAERLQEDLATMVLTEELRRRVAARERDIRAIVESIEAYMGMASLRSARRRRRDPEPPAAPSTSLGSPAALLQPEAEAEPPLLEDTLNKLGELIMLERIYW